MTLALARRYVQITLGHVSREFPHKADHVMDGAYDLYRPRSIHPVFFGSFDWHSCVHGFWQLVRLRRLFPSMPEAGAIEALMNDRLTRRNVDVELTYLQRASSRGFERPYGWAWILKLQAELCLDESSSAQVWRDDLEPLALAFADRFKKFLPLQTYPVRAGAHGNSAFALTLVSDFATCCGDTELRAMLAEKTLQWFGSDTNAVAWEPSGEDFLSPTLCTAQAMKRLLPQPDFQSWFERYLPGLAQREPSSLFEPAHVSDRSDGRIAHLDGLNLSRAWAWRELASSLDGPAREIVEKSANQHLAAALPHIADHYMGEHWLATFAVLAMTDSPS
ncbi:DUF2891 domain-containing protein [Massilia sp. LjRoot122]|uniref:DUF2891 domain-containing protein n=1 Tax=Massilia sp. LjRoot122 TaxID=3342257 RepID=UPI003ECD661A